MSGFNFDKEQVGKGGLPPLLCQVVAYPSAGASHTCIDLFLSFKEHSLDGQQNDY